MNISIICSKCKKELEVKDIQTTMNGLHNITTEVTSCDNIDCYDCGKCEMEERMTKEIEELKNNIQTLTATIGRAKDELTA